MLRLFNNAANEFAGSIKSDEEPKLGVYGLREGEWQEFIRGIEYEAFLVKRRS